ncbi:MAG: hypothetical protein LBJ62_02400 [Bifidobacteriaceae bacterium]|nr:hypothetical protein [Bifidobacteriaceae bacterium]
MPIKVDLRSDTVTKPSQAMRQAMAQAEVGDDVIDRDPTVRLLEERTANIMAQPAGLFVPSGSMSNLVALMTHLGRGDRYFAPRSAHILTHELGTAAWLAGGMAGELPWSLGPGIPSPDDVTAAAQEEPAKPAYYDLIARLLCLENTHNQAGGTVIRQAVAFQLVDAAHQVGWSVHLDGARIWHAAAAQGLTPSQAAGPVDSVTVCFSKGLGAPVGSMLCAPTGFIEQARRWRKALGGGMRQAGVLAAAALVALDQELPRIDQDRLRAVRLASALRELGLDSPEPDTNIVMVRPAAGSGLTPGQLAAAWAAAGVGCLVMGTAVRLVTHRDIDDSALGQAVDLIANATRQAA